MRVCVIGRAALFATAMLLPAYALAQGIRSTNVTGLVTARQVARIPAKATVMAEPVYGHRPLTAECYARLNSRKEYNILLANESKKSATHWEVFTLPKSGLLSAYLPGCQPDLVQTAVNVADGGWHHVALVLEEQRVRLFADGKLAGEQAFTRRGGERVAGSLVIGGLDGDGLGCTGEILWVRLSNAVREIGALSAAVPAADAATIGLWRFDQGCVGRVPDLSSRGEEAALITTQAAPVEKGIWPNMMQGGMSAAFLPMPPAKEVSEERRLLASVIAEVGLKAVPAAGQRDGVLRYWLTEYENWRADLFAPGQLEYPQSRPSSGQINRDKVAEQAYDKQALVLPSDGGALGTALRRTGALLDWLAKSSPTLDLAALTRDYAALKTRVASKATKPGSPEDIALYLAVCAVRREIALRNPLLNFDQLLCVARGTFEGSARSNPSTGDVQGGHFTTQYFGFNALPGGGLYALKDFKTSPRLVNLLENSVVQSGRLKGRKLDHGAFATPDLSFDGRRIVFAWTANREHKWVYAPSTVFHLFSVNVDGTDLTQLTDGDEGDFDPCWLPDGRIAFVSERRGGFIRCFGGLQVRNYTLFSMKADGTDIVPLSYYETSEWNPSVNNEGKLVYTRWDYTDRENCLGTRFWISGPDGTDPRAPHGNYPKPYHTFPGFERWQGAAMISASARRWSRSASARFRTRPATCSPARPTTGRFTAPSGCSTSARPTTGTCRR